MNKQSSSFIANRDHRKLKQLATEFRLAIEKCQGVRTIIVTFSNFPRGSCGEASLFLAKYLEENNCGCFNYILGDREGRSHAWLEQGDVIVDITADQFDDNDQPVIVTVNHNWHSQFSGEVQHVANLDGYDKYNSALLRSGYETILKEIKRAPQSENKL